MKLSFTTLGCPDWDFMKILKNTRELGIDSIEIRGLDGQMRAENISWFSEQNAVETKKILADHKVSICGFGTSVNFHDAQKRADAIVEGKEAITVCARMGIPYIRVFGDKLQGLDRDAVIKSVIDGISELCAYAKGTGVGVLLEIHGDFNTLDAVLPVIEGVKASGADNFGILWDIEHSDKTYEDNYLEFYEPIKDYVKHVHVKDHKRDGGQFNLCMIGEGDIPIPAILKTLKQNNYSGYLSLEWEKKWKPELPVPELAFPAFVEYMKKVML